MKELLFITLWHLGRTWYTSKLLSAAFYNPLWAFVSLLSVSQFITFEALLLQPSKRSFHSISRQLFSNFKSFAVSSVPIFIHNPQVLRTMIGLWNKEFKLGCLFIEYLSVTLLKNWFACTLPFKVWGQYNVLQCCWKNHLIMLTKTVSEIQ